MNDVEKLTLHYVIAKMKTIAKTQYNDMLYDNVLAIFNQLSIKEKRILLKGLINTCMLMEDAFQAANRKIENNSDVTYVTKVEKEVDDIDIYNKKELVNLKTWFAKAGFVGMSILFTLTVMFVVIFSDSDNVVIRSLGHVGTVLKTIVGE